jgi:superfamily II DNA/RNA helicase
LNLDHVKQFYYKCPKRGKIDFVEEIFEACSSTQTIIFVNTKSFAETLMNILRKKGLKIFIIFANMTNEERDEYVEKFRR